MSKEVDQNKLQRRGKGQGRVVWRGGRELGVRDNFKYHLCPSVKRGVRMVRPCRKKCSGGLRYQCALALSGGRAGCLVPQQPPTPSAEVDGVLLWKHGYEHFYHNQHIYIRHEETNEINCIFKFWIPFLFSYPQSGFIQYSVCLFWLDFPV